MTREEKWAQFAKERAEKTMASRRVREANMLGNAVPMHLVVRDAVAEMRRERVDAVLAAQSWLPTHRQRIEAVEELALFESWVAAHE